MCVRLPGAPLASRLLSGTKPDDQRPCHRIHSPIGVFRLLVLALRISVASLPGAYNLSTLMRNSQQADRLSQLVGGLQGRLTAGPAGDWLELRISGLDCASLP